MSSYPKQLPYPTDRPLNAPPSYEETLATTVPSAPPLNDASLTQYAVAPPFNGHSVSNYPVAPPPFNSSSASNVQVVMGPTVSILSVGSRPIKAKCPNCQRQIKSRTSVKNGMCKKLILCTILCSCCLCCLPFCLGGPSRVIHTCPSCCAHLGTYNY